MSICWMAVSTIDPREEPSTDFRSQRIGLNAVM
jgi:hypothetical protein